MIKDIYECYWTLTSFDKEIKESISGNILI